MRNGLKFKNKHSSEFEGVTVKTRDRPIMPKPKISTYTADNMNGDIDFTDYTGFTYYETRTFTVDFSVLGTNLNDLQNKINKLAVWLQGKGELVFDDIPAVIWIARVSDTIPYMPEKGMAAVLTVQFMTEPFSKFLHDAFDGVQLGDPIRLGTRIRLGAPTYYTLTAGDNEIEIMGDAPVMPIFKKTTTGAWTVTVTNSHGEKTVHCSQSALTTIDCEKKQVFKTDNSENYMVHTKGDFPVLMPDEKNIINTNKAMELHYVPLFFYNGGMS